MKLGRNFIIGAVVALSSAGPIVASVVAPAGVAAAPAVHVVAGSSYASPSTYFRG